MNDVMTPIQRSRCMSRIRGNHTKPEIALRKALWNIGLRYRLKSQLPGRPDLVFTRERIAIFVDGCFWHLCPQHSTLPKTNANFWSKKLKSNADRDKNVNSELAANNWLVLRIWEHEIEQHLMAVAERIRKELEKRRRFGNDPHPHASADKASPGSEK